jgi:hypothetical protein
MTRKRELFKTIALIAFLAAGLYLVRIGVLPLWAWGLLTLAVIFMRVIARMDRYVEELSVTDDGVVRTHGSRMRKQMHESVRWDELTQVEAISQEAGPEKKEVLFLLHGAQGRGVAVRGALAQQHDLPAQLRRRLPGFQDDQLAQALAAGERHTFVLWERSGP